MSLTLASFEQGPQSLTAPPGMSNTSTVTTTSAFHTDGLWGLSVTVPSAQWLGIALFPARDFSGRSRIKADVSARSAATSRKLAITSGASGWCEAAVGSIPLQGTTTLDVALSDLSCAGGNLNAVSGVYLWFDAGTFYVDNFRVE